MASTSASTSVDGQITTLLERLDAINAKKQRLERQTSVMSLTTEMRSLDLWRCVVAECVGVFLLVFLTSGGSVVAARSGVFPLVFAAAFGSAVAALTHVFGKVSGGHLNPAVTLASLAVRRSSLLRSFMYVIAQCGGSIAGAAVLYGVTIPGSQGNLGCTLPAGSINSWQACAMEFIISFVVVASYFAAEPPRGNATHNKYNSWSPLPLGVAYAVCSLVAVTISGASMNPARSLGPAFVMNKWDGHWIYWIGPNLGGLLAALMHKFVFVASAGGSVGGQSSSHGGGASQRRSRDTKDSVDGAESSSLRCSDAEGDADDEVEDDDMTYDDLERTTKMANAFNALSAMRTQHQHQRNYENQQHIYGTRQPNARPQPIAEPLYSGTKSLYGVAATTSIGNKCGSPVSPRRAATSLNRSQSVYSKIPSHRSEYGGYPKASHNALSSARSVHSVRQPVDPSASILYVPRPSQASTPTGGNYFKNQQQSNARKMAPPPMLYTSLPPIPTNSSPPQQVADDSPTDSAYGGSLNKYTAGSNGPVSPAPPAPPPPPPPLRTIRNDLYASSPAHSPGTVYNGPSAQY